VVGGSGVIPPPPGYLEGVRELCTEHGIIYISDEVLVGFGRTGAWFGVDHAGVSPDLMAFAKGVNSGYVPLGGVLVGDPIHDTFVERPYPGGLTYAGHPLACAAAVGAITAMQDEGMIASAARLGTEVLGPGLRELAERHPSVGEVRGIGALWALELVRDPATREPMVPYAAAGPAFAPMAALGAACLERGMIIFPFGNRINVAPPLNLSDAEAEAGLAILDEVLSIADGYAA
jgi:taurine--2-oxoglutarate transaminase